MNRKAKVAIKTSQGIWEITNINNIRLSTFTMDILCPSKSQNPARCQQLWATSDLPKQFSLLAEVMSVVLSPFSTYFFSNLQLSSYLTILSHGQPSAWPMATGRVVRQSDSCASPGVHGQDPGAGVPLQVSIGLPGGRGLVGSVWITVFVQVYYVFSALREQFLRY